MTTTEKHAQYILPTYGRLPLTPARAQGTELWGEDGKRYLDFCTGIAVCSIGHCHPRLTQAIQKQAETLMHCSNLYHIPAQADLAEIIVEDFVKIPGKVFFGNSGAEANDGLIKLARRFGHHKRAADGSARTDIITFGMSFHGRTLGGLSATGQASIQEGFSPILPGFSYANFNDIESVKSLITEHTCAILLEPVQGEGGVIVADPSFLTELKNLCQEHDLLLMFDEVQVGFGRLGTEMGWRAIAPDVEPDAISWAKGLGGGFPIGAFWASDRSTDSNNTPLSTLLGSKSHGSTYGGNPLGCAAAHAVLSEIKESDLCDNAQRQETRIRETIMSWNSPAIEEVRGKGLLLGIGLNADAFTAIKEGLTPALHLMLKLTNLGLLTVAAGPSTLRLLPPLNVSAEEIDEALEILKNALASTEQG